MSKRVYSRAAPAVLSLSLLALAGCGGGGGGGGGSASATVTGRITESSGLPVGGVTVKVGGASTTTKADGSYALTVTPGTGLKVDALKAGYVGTLDLVNLANGQTAPVDFILTPVGVSLTLTNLKTTVTQGTTDGVEVVHFPAGSILDSAGNPVDSAKVEVTIGKPGDPGYTETFPGLFVGTQGGVDKAIESFGIVTVNLDCGGSPCKIDPAKPANLSIPVYPGADPGTPTIALWSLDTATGKWVYEGEATRDAMAVPVLYNANVTHFSTYNLDRAIEARTELKVNVTNNSSPVAGAAVVVRTSSPSGAVWEGRGVTGADGSYTVPEMPQGTVNVSALAGDMKGVGYSYTVDSPGKAHMDVALTRMLTREIFFYRMVGGVKTPVVGAHVMAWGFTQGGPGGADYTAYTGSDGKLTLDFASGSTLYNVSADITIDGVRYSVYSNTPEIPTELQLLQP